MEELHKGGQAGEIRIVLVEPRSPGNIGSVARVMKNTGFRDLVLVNPVEFRNDEAFSMACKAGEMLLGPPVFQSLEEAVKGSGVVVGTTRRKGKTRYPILTLYDAVPKILSLARRNTVSILFGREDKGLRNDEISLCDLLVEIPTHNEYPSLNLSHAVFAVCHAFFNARTPAEPSMAVASREDVEMMYEHLERTLRLLGYGDAVKRSEFLLRSMMRNFRKLFGRTALMPREVNMVRGVLTRIEERLSSKGRSRSA